MNNQIDRATRIIFLPLLIAAGLAVSGCHRTRTDAKRYPFTGRIISIDSQSGAALIDGDNVPGFMDPMAMSYKIRPASVLRDLAPGDSISAEVVVFPPNPKDEDAEGESWLESVKVTAHAKSPPAKGPTSMHIPAPGERVPDFAFTNQDGQRVSLDSYRGKIVFVTFIYTRCPFPDFCPRMSSNFDQIYKQLANNPSLDGAQLLSVSFDPAHDTPKVLRAYGYSVAHIHDSSLFKRWQFVAPADADLAAIADFFALTVKPEGGMITHSLSTAVIGPDRRIISWYHGSDWQVSDLIKDAGSATVQKS